MNEPAHPPIRFDSPAASASAQCSGCKGALSGTYYAVGDQPVCPSCKGELEQSMQRRAGFAGFLRALLFGSVGGLLGAALWYGVRALTGYEIGIIAIAIGYLVGHGIRRGSGGVGGLGFQILAALLTYFWIVVNYVPDLYAGFAQMESATEATPATVKLASSVLMAFALPFMQGWNNAIGILIIGFGLYTAWTANKRVPLVITGPFTLNSPVTSAHG